MTTETTISRPAPFVEDIGKSLAEQTLALQNVPVVSTGIAGISQQQGETAAGFKARQDAARAFTTRQQNLAGLAPQVAGQDALQRQAQSLAQAGVGSFQPFLQTAQTLTGAGAGTGAGSVASFMSPYQSQVIDTTLQEFDRQKQIQEQRIRDQAVASGAFGGGREGVQLAEFGTGAARDRAALQAGLLQQGFGQAVARRDQAFRDQQGLAQLLPQLQGTDISRLGSLGSLNQAQAQAQLDATREATRQAAFAPQDELNRFADITTGIMGGMRGSGTQTTNIPNPSPLQSALGIGSTLAGIYGYLGGRPFA
jgi:hypothetical protein